MMMMHSPGALQRLARRDTLAPPGRPAGAPSSSRPAHRHSAGISVRAFAPVQLLCTAGSRGASLLWCRRGPLAPCRAAAAVAAGAAGNGAAAQPGGPTVRVRWHINYRVQPGDQVAVVGAGESLGNWQVAQRVPLEWHEGDDWAGGVDVPAGSTLEYKYIVVRRGGVQVEWSPGHNFKLEVPHSKGPGCSADVREGWANQGPRTVSVCELEPERAAGSAGPAAAAVPAAAAAAGAGASSVAAAAGVGVSASAADVANGAASKVQGATDRLARVEWEAAVVSLLGQYPLMPPDRLHRAMQALKPKRPDITLDQLQALLGQMVKAEAVVELGGRYRLHAGHRYAASGKPTTTTTTSAIDSPAAAAANGSAPSVAAKPAATASSGPQPSSSAANGAAAAAAGAAGQLPANGVAKQSGGSSSVTAGATVASGGVDGSSAVLSTAVMRLLEAYASMSLDRMLRALSQAGPSEVQGLTEASLKDTLAVLQQEGKVALGSDGQYRKGAAASAPNRRAATPSASRRPPVHGGPSPGPSSATLYGHHRPQASADPHPTSSTSSSSSSSSAVPAAASVSQPPMTREQLAVYEQRALSLLSNYAACTPERVHAQLRGTSDFPGTVEDMLRLLRALATEGRVKESDGIFTYQSTRHTTPTGARGLTPSSPAHHLHQQAHHHQRATSAASAAAGGVAVRMARSSAASSSSTYGAATASAVNAVTASSSLPAAPGVVRPHAHSPTLSRGMGIDANGSVGTGGGGGGGHRKASARRMAVGALPASAAGGQSDPASLSPSPNQEGGGVRHNLSAYSIFCAERRHALRSSMPRATYSELTHALAREWEAAPAATRRRFVQAAEADKRRYVEEVKRRFTI